ncbi:unnamed protein product [Adineta ricciae]|uniref:Exonuclease domain-containing protein n=1 Tax=Adineta ricciae TaxID=249248 RepID=A0A815RED5_ADIRI|nr:unnamed protein product [Adineta ricciae]
MSMKDLSKDLQRLFQNRIDENRLIKKLDELINEYGIRQINAWRNLSNGTKNTLLHEVIEQNYPNVVKHLIIKHQLRTFFQRESDHLTPFELAFTKKNRQICDILIELGDENTLENVSENISLKKSKDQMMNIIWMDLEFTSFENPQILECAVIITNKDLKEIQRKQWIIHFEKEFLNGLSQWHQNAFKDIEDGGNGLFRDVYNSEIRKEDVEKELLEFLKEFCPEKTCPLAGSSIHSDKAVLKVEMPSVYHYLHHRVIDVSSFQEILKRWAPKINSQFCKDLISSGKGNVNHRAMDDILWSIEMMKLFRPLLTNKQFLKDKDSSMRIQRRNPSMNSSRFDQTKFTDEEKHLFKRIEFEEQNCVEDLNLNEEEQQIYVENPHLREVFLNNERILFHEKDFQIEDRLCSPMKFSKQINSRVISTTEFWSQRNLLLGEIEFLTKYSSKQTNLLVIYLENSSNSHFNHLSQLFPQIQFHVFRTKSNEIKETKQLKIFNEIFTNEIALKYSSHSSLLFICNLQRFENDENIDKDTKNEIRWISILKPLASFLRFSFPKTHCEMLEFYQGDLYWNLWSSPESVECRIMIENLPKLIFYDWKQFQQSFFYFQQIKRTMFYQHDLDHIETEGLDHCYDCTAEIFILKNYFTSIQHIHEKKSLFQSIAQLSHQISLNLFDKHQFPFLKQKRSLNIIPKD